MVIILILHSWMCSCKRWTGGKLVIVEELDGWLVAPRSLFPLFSEVVFEAKPPQ